MLTIELYTHISQKLFFLLLFRKVNFLISMCEYIPIVKEVVGHCFSLIIPKYASVVNIENSLVLNCDMTLLLWPLQTVVTNIDFSISLLSSHSIVNI